MIAAATELSLGGLVGWLVGLTLHGFRQTRWQDPGARAAWAAGAGAVGLAAGLGALTVCLLTGAAILLLPTAASATVCAAAGWRASHAIRLTAPGTGDENPRWPHRREPKRT